jgi:hypothetical protein
VQQIIPIFTRLVIAVGVPLSMLTVWAQWWSSQRFGQQS